MHEMTTLDLLYMTIAVCASILTLFASGTLIYAMFILRDFTKISARAKDLTEKVETYITKPIMLTKSIIEFASPYLESAHSLMKKRRKEK